MPKRIQRKRIKGWKMPENTIYVGRPTKWGNPFRVENGQMYYYCNNRDILSHWLLWDNKKADYEVEDAVELYERWLKGGYLNIKGLPSPPSLSELKGKDLACWCPEDIDFMQCHADVLLEYVNRKSVVRF